MNEVYAWAHFDASMVSIIRQRCLVMLGTFSMPVDVFESGFDWPFNIGA